MAYQQQFILIDKRLKLYEIQNNNIIMVYKITKDFQQMILLIDKNNFNIGKIIQKKY